MRLFGEKVPAACKAHRAYVERGIAQGYDLDKVTIRVSAELGIDPAQVWTYGKHPLTVKARSLLCYWAVRKLGFSATELSKKLGISQPSVSISVKRGEKIAKAEQLELVED